MYREYVVYMETPQTPPQPPPASHWHHHRRSFSRLRSIYPSTVGGHEVSFPFRVNLVLAFWYVQTYVLIGWLLRMGCWSRGYALALVDTVNLQHCTKVYSMYENSSCFTFLLLPVTYLLSSCLLILAILVGGVIRFYFVVPLMAIIFISICIKVLLKKSLFLLPMLILYIFG